MLLGKAFLAVLSHLKPEQVAGGCRLQGSSCVGKRGSQNLKIKVFWVPGIRF